MTAMVIILISSSSFVLSSPYDIVVVKEGSRVTLYVLDTMHGSPIIVYTKIMENPNTIYLLSADVPKAAWPMCLKGPDGIYSKSSFELSRKYPTLLTKFQALQEKYDQQLINYKSNSESLENHKIWFWLLVSALIIETLLLFGGYRSSLSEEKAKEAVQKLEEEKRQAREDYRYPKSSGYPFGG